MLPFTAPGSQAQTPVLGLMLRGHPGQEGLTLRDVVALHGACVSGHLGHLWGTRKRNVEFTVSKTLCDWGGCVFPRGPDLGSIHP